MKKTKPITVKFQNRLCYVFFGEYENGRTAIQLDLKSNGDPFIVATHNIPEAENRLDKDEVIIKAYGENEGILDVLVKAGIVKFNNSYVMFNGIKWPVARLLINPHSNQSQMITKNNYFDQVKAQNILSRFPEAREYHDFVVEATANGSDWSAYESEADTKVLINDYIHRLNEKLSKQSGSNATRHEKQQSKNRNVEHKSGRQPRGAAKRARNTKPAKQEKKKKAEKKPAKQKRKVLNLPKGKLVELVDPHLLFVGRFLRMNNEKRSRNAVEKFFAQINQAADARILRKASPYSNHILYIQKRLLNYLSGKRDEITVEIPAAKFDELLRSVAKEQQMSSVRLLKRYHNMAGRPTTIEKAKKLYNEMYQAIEKGKIPQNDRLFKRVTKVMRDLSDYVKAEDTSSELVRLPAELGGVLGFMDGCLCSKDRELKVSESPHDINFRFKVN